MSSDNPCQTKIKNGAELIPDEWTLTISSKNKSERIKKLEEYFRRGLVKIPTQIQFFRDGVEWNPTPLWYLQAMAYRKKYDSSHTKEIEK